MATSGFTIKVDNSGKVLKDLAKAKERALTMIGMIAENYAVYEIENNPRRVDTGRLKNSITYKVEGEKAVHVGTNVEYAQYVHFGTVKMRENPFLYKAFNNHLDEYKDILKSELSK